MSSQTQQILEQALRLPINDRADVAAELLRSLDEVESTMPPEEIDRRWAEEITRRAERAIRGEQAGRDADEILSSIESKLRRR
ncbi:MAG TPA: addiction module protein [Kofleriaceae bacterium]|nr:addiction module protein [Kofleriaceae bacterium]